MSALPTLEERRDRKLALAIACLQDAFAHLEDAKPMIVSNGTYYEKVDSLSTKVAEILTGDGDFYDYGLARLAALVKGRIL